MILWRGFWTFGGFGGERLRDDVLAEVPHRQWVFTIPKRLRVYFRFTRSLLGKLSKAAYETVREVMQFEIGEEDYLPAMVSAIQTFGSLANWHSHTHGIVAEGVFTPDGHFIPIPDLQLERAKEIWRDKVFDLLFAEGLIRLDTIDSMMLWKHSGFNIDASVRIEADDHDGMQRLVEYISRCPFSLARMIKLTDDDKVLYRANHANCTRYPMLGKEMDLRPGMSRNYQVFDPLDFLASVTQHIPNKGEHQRKWKMTWAALIKCVYEVDPLKCPRCGEQMRIISFIEAKTHLYRHSQKAKALADVIKSILKHCGLWKKKEPRPPPQQTEKAPQIEYVEHHYDYSFFDDVCA